MTIEYLQRHQFFELTLEWKYALKSEQAAAANVILHFLTLQESTPCWRFKANDVVTQAELMAGAQ